MHRMREGSLKSHPQDGREDRVQDACADFWLGGSRGESTVTFARILEYWRIRRRTLEDRRLED